MKKLLISFLFLLIATIAFGTQRHSTPSGAGAHTGMDLSNAWSFAEARYAEPGDTVNYHSGTYPYIFDPANNGTASQPIVHRAYSTDVVTFTGVSDGNPDIAYFSGSYVELWNVYLITGDNVAYDGDYAVSLGGNHNTMHDVKLIHGGNIQTEYLTNHYRTRGISVSGQYNTVDSCWVRGMTEAVVLSGGSPRYHKIRWNRIHNTVNNGVICGGTNDGSSSWMSVLIEGNNIDTCSEDGIQCQPCTDPFSYEKNKGYIVRGNYIANCDENAIDRKGVAYMVVENNIIHTANSDDDGWTNGTEDWGTGPLIERGNPETINEYWCLDRGNVMWNGPGGITMSHGGQFLNNLMANNRRKLTVSNTSDSTEQALKDINLEGSSTTRSVLNNILIGQPNHSYVWLYNMETSPLDIDNQLYYDSTGALRFYYRLSGGTSAKIYGLAAWQSRLNTTYTSFTGRDAHAISLDPLFVNFPFRPYGYNASWDWSLDAGSPALGAARCWTFANGAGSPSTSLVVDNPYVFTDGFGIVQGDSIDIDGTVRRITAINYSTSTITLNAGATWSDNDSVWFYTSGARVTNLGPYANVTTVIDTSGDPGSVPSTPSPLTPPNGSSRTSPVTFSWNSVPGAENYWLCVSPDSWSSLIVDQAAITDTFYTVSLPGSGSYIWNMSAANSYGRSGWTPDFTFSTTATSTYRDTITLSWNIVSHNVTVDTNCVINFSDLNRRDIFVALHNAGSYEVTWQGVSWKTTQPPTIPLNDSWFKFYRAGTDTVWGEYVINSTAANVTWASIAGDPSSNSALESRLTDMGVLIDSLDSRVSVLEGVTGGGSTFGDSVSTATGTGSSLTFPHRIFGLNRLLVVSVSVTFASVTGVTYNGDAMTLSSSREFSGFGGFVYYLTAPDTGTHDVVVSLSGSVDVAATACGYIGIDQVTPISAATYDEGTSTTPSLTMSSATDNFMLGLLCWNIDGAPTATATAGQVEMANTTVGDYCGHAISIKPGAASVTSSWTIGASKEWVVIGLSIHRSGDGGTEGGGEITGISAATAAAMIGDSVVARSDDYATPTHTHTGVYTTPTNVKDSLIARADDYVSASGDTMSGNLYIGAGGLSSYPLSINGTSSLYGSVYIRDGYYIGSYSGSASRLKFENATATATLDGGLSVGGAIVGGGNLTIASGYLNANGVYNSATTWKMWGSATWFDMITRVTVGSQKMVNYDSVNLINGKSIARIDSASLVIAMAGTSWLATTNTDTISGPILMPRYFVVDSVMVALAGIASTDTIKIDVRYGPDYSAVGTAVVTTPAQIAASGLWTRTVPNSATIPAFNSVWMRVTKKTGAPKRLTVMLKGRWQ